MKRIATQENSFLKRLVINIPFVLMVAAMIAGFGGGALLAFYSIVSLVAFHSAMIYLIVAGAAAILIGLALGLITLFKKYYAFYNKKMGWKFVGDEKDNLSNKTNKENNSKDKTVTYDNKSFLETLKKFLTLQNVAIGILAIGSVFAIISAALGCIDRNNWVKEVGGYRQERGYYADVKYQPVSYFIDGEFTSQQPITNINVFLPEDMSRKKKVVVVYTNDLQKAGFIEIAGYKKFETDFTTSRTADGTININIGVAPPLNDSLDKLLFFVFNDYRAERQIVIYIPSSRKDISVNYDEDIIIAEENAQH